TRLFDRPIEQVDLEPGFAAALRRSVLGSRFNRRLVSNAVPFVRPDRATVRGIAHHHLWDIDLEAAAVKDLRALVAEPRGEEVRVDGAWILDYHVGGFQGLHTDYERCKLTLLLGLDTRSRPLILHPSALALEELRSLADREPHPKGQEVSYGQTR